MQEHIDFLLHAWGDFFTEGQIRPRAPSAQGSTCAAGGGCGGAHLCLRQQGATGPPHTGHAPVQWDERGACPRPNGGAPERTSGPASHGRPSARHLAAPGVAEAVCPATTLDTSLMAQERGRGASETYSGERGWAMAWQRAARACPTRGCAEPLALATRAQSPSGQHLAKPRVSQGPPPAPKGWKGPWVG